MIPAFDFRGVALNLPATSAMLLARLGTGTENSDAWARFVVLYGPHILRWCRNYGLQDSDAQDVAQEVLLQISKQIGQFRYDPSKRFRGWLRAVVHSSWYAWISRSREWHHGHGDDAIYERLEAEAARDDLAARIDAEYDRELFEMACESVRRRIEPQSWEAFRLLAIEGLSGREVAERLGMKPNTSFVARFRVQRMIQEEIERLDPPE